MEWINNDRWIFWLVCSEGSISFLLWEILIYIDIENIAVNSDAINKNIINLVFQLIILDSNIISLIVLIVGGAEILIAIKMNHQKFILGIILINPLNDKIFREEYL